ncbi:LOW QUALITY PROTEIN: E3 ubiquitin-protein ligase TRIM7-like [Heteronotia binoei]|uniref:LOW QUALITY PROTEIN: E3 ubiquitin-protein ligase TRIM7-like n=1 Tax=Heteronotia binoei TaxID=13085 RepID=UPI00292FE379|nr:LOW QUALITY PROTEIN: E3 ubiquitin-protein ligase TRIM7-like [Heteronotia binoei]
MAAEGPVQELCEEASCSICLDFFRDPVTIAQCGHNFCRACLTRSWGESGAEASCPQCRGPAREGDLRPNYQLASIVEIAKKFTLREGKDAAGANGQLCQKHQELPRLFCKGGEDPLCAGCGIAQEQRGTTVIPLEEAARDSRAMVAAEKGRVCQKHQEPLKLFCKDDEALICVVCDRSKEHREHETLPLEEASQEYKDRFCSCLEILKKERERIVSYKGDVEKESQDLLKQTKGEKQETVAKFRQLHMFLEEQEKLLLAQMEEVEMEVAKKRDQRLAELSEALSSLESLIQEMEEKCQQSASELLQDARSTLQRYEEKKAFEKPVTFSPALKWRIWDVCDVHHLLEGVVKQLKDTLDSGLHPQKAKVTLDSDTAHLILVLSEDQKSMREGDKAQRLPDNPKRFDRCGIVLGCEEFTGGCHFWEVLVGNEEQWAVGVARRSVRRKGSITFSPEEGFWVVRKWSGGFKASVEEGILPLTVTDGVKRIRVCLNYTGGRVAFFDADKASLLYEFSGAFSGETLLPFFGVHLKGRLQLS